MQDNNIDYMDMTPSMRKYKPKNKTTTSLYRVEFLKTIQILNTHTHTNYCKRVTHSVGKRIGFHIEAEENHSQ